MVRKREAEEGLGITKSVGKMLTLKRGLDDITISPSELIEEVPSNFSNVVSLALSDGHSVLFACSGITIEHKRNFTRFLTSASLVKAFNDKTKDRDNLKIEVRCEGNFVVGCLDEYDLDHEIAFVKVMTFLNVHEVLPNHVMKYLSGSKVVAVGRDISGKLITTDGMLISDSNGSEDAEEFMLSTCKISEGWEGGALFDSDGNLIGMNLLFLVGRSLFLPISIIIERLEYFRTSYRRRKFFALATKLKAIRVGGRLSIEMPKSLLEDVCDEDQFECLDSMGYPMPSINGMVLVNTFEETFGDLYDEGVWSELSKNVSSRISRNVVSLASFNGETRYFACTGFFIEWNGCTSILTSASLVRKSGDRSKIVENLRIEVLLPNKKRTEGTLEHCNLHYNVAIVSVKDFRALCPANLHHEQESVCEDVLAVGRCFESDILMAASGHLVGWSGTLDCRMLRYANFKITKAGIGGPLIDFDGRYVGINFFDDIVGTPFLSCTVILHVLSRFDEERTINKVGNGDTSSGVLDWTMTGDRSVRPNSWPVPKPFWCHPDDLPRNETRTRHKYGYYNGQKFKYMC
ncbi:hypothetical protein DAI22_01g345300 [Oryza sativa Japonica Group]|nr:hypothetical protein DAI22_01g345300 [Oryza sativa Japonica Group]